MENAARITKDKNGRLNVPDMPIIPFIEGDGIGPDIWRATKMVLDAAVRVSSGGQKRIAWLEVLAGELACRKEHRLEVAVDHFKKALGCAERLEPVFGCEVCGRLAPDWKYRCPHCGSYNSYDISERICSFG